MNKTYNCTVTVELQVGDKLKPVYVMGPNCKPTKKICGFKDAKGNVFKPFIGLEKQGKEYEDLTCDEALNVNGFHLVDFVDRFFERM